MSWKDLFLTEEARKRLATESAAQAGGASPVVPPAGADSVPIAATAGVSAVSSVSAAVGSGHDPQLVESIIAAISGSVPDLQRLLKKADAIMDTVPDMRQRMDIVMRLEQITPSQAGAIVSGLRQALQNTGAQAQGELDEFKRGNIDVPSQTIAKNEASVRDLSERIAELQSETATLTRSVADAQQQLAAKSQQVESSLRQVETWLASMAGLLGAQKTQ